VVDVDVPFDWELAPWSARSVPERRSTTASPTLWVIMRIARSACKVWLVGQPAGVLPQTVV
jgi:hypothetical protein